MRIRYYQSNKDYINVSVCFALYFYLCRDGAIGEAYCREVRQSQCFLECPRLTRIMCLKRTLTLAMIDARI